MTCILFLFEDIVDALVVKLNIFFHKFRAIDFLIFPGKELFKQKTKSNFTGEMKNTSTE